MNKFGIDVYEIDEYVSLRGKYVLLKEEAAISSATIPSLLRKVTFDCNDGQVITIAYDAKLTSGQWDRESFEGWISDGDAQKIIVWERLLYGTV